jgi:uncharacterized membrane protein
MHKKEEEEFGFSKQNPKKKTLDISSNNIQVHKNIESVGQLEKNNVHNQSFASRIADKVTSAAGSMPFIIIHILWFAYWVSINSNIIPGFQAFDPFPFSFLTLVVSLEAIFLSLLVLMSQNQMTNVADKRAHLDLQINMLAEQESTITLRILKRISDHLGLEEELDEEMEELSSKTDINEIVKNLDENTTD